MVTLTETDKGGQAPISLTLEPLVRKSMALTTGAAEVSIYAPGWKVLGGKVLIEMQIQRWEGYSKVTS